MYARIPFRHARALCGVGRGHDLEAVELTRGRRGQAGRACEGLGRDSGTQIDVGGKKKRWERLGDLYT